MSELFKDRMKQLQEFYFRHGIIPTYRQMAEMFVEKGEKPLSTGSIFKFIQKAEKNGYVERVPVRLKPTNKFFL